MATINRAAIKYLLYICYGTKTSLFSLFAVRGKKTSRTYDVRRDSAPRCLGPISSSSEPSKNARVFVFFQSFRRTHALTAACIYRILRRPRAAQYILCPFFISFMLTIFAINKTRHSSFSFILLPFTTIVVLVLVCVQSFVHSFF